MKKPSVLVLGLWPGKMIRTNIYILCVTKDTIYLADSLPNLYPDCHTRLRSKLEENCIVVNYISGTRDIWCRDYMPVQVNENKFVKF